MLKADSDLSKLIARAAESDLSTYLSLDGAGDLADRVVSGVAGLDSGVEDDFVKVPALMKVNGRVEVVNITLFAIVDRGGAGTVLGPLVEHKPALLERRPVGVEVLVHLGIAVDVFFNLGLSVRVGAAVGIPAGVVGPEAVKGNTAVELGNAGGKEAAPVTAEGALPGLGENHVGPFAHGFVLAVGIHVAVVTAGEPLVLKSVGGNKNTGRNSKDSNSLH